MISQSKELIHRECIRFSSKPIQLKNNYFLILDTIADKRVLRLKGPAIDTIIRSNYLKASEFNLGYLQFDADSFFVISTDNGLVDTNMVVYNKLTGKKLLNGKLFSFSILTIDFEIET